MLLLNQGKLTKIFGNDFLRENCTCFINVRNIIVENLQKRFFDKFKTNGDCYIGSFPVIFQYI
jgi:hypothetical protein